ncbi:MAG: hypothetical protein JXQ73_30665 [Phycisphaerae bacterium]|nr:hypothetical protein [Phycisphaerae bacterium]
MTCRSPRVGWYLITSLAAATFAPTGLPGGVAAAGSEADSGHVRGARGEGRFGQGLVSLTDPKHRAQLPGRDVYRRPPLTVECWAKLYSSDRFNILVASEEKSSPAHWEIYSYINSGRFSAYLPGNDPPEIVSGVDITDDKWHHAAMVNDGSHIRLYVDAKQVAVAPYNRKLGTLPPPGPLILGYVGGNACDGVIDDVRVSSAARPIETLPSAPLAWEPDTLALCHFEGKASAKAPPRDTNRKSRLVIGPQGLPSQRRIWSETTWPEELAVNGVRKEVVDDWKMQFDLLNDQIRGLGISALPPKAAEQVYDRHALIHKTDRDPVDVVLRRTGALLDHIETDLNAPGLSDLRGRFDTLKRAAAATDPMTLDRKTDRVRQDLYLRACALRREIAFKNPLLDFDSILFVVRGVIHGPNEENTDWFGQHQTTQYFAFNSVPGGGIYAIKDWKAPRPEIVDVLKDSVVQSGRLQGRKLDHGAFISPDLSCDGKTILFSHTENAKHREHVKESWTKESCWHVFRVDADGSNLVQLTDGPWNDFDACWLPNGRIALISERRGGFIRCFVTMWVPNYVLHSMKADGSDVIPLSYFETSEWTPSVSNDGMLVYSRWDYVDRNDCLGSNFWICYPDGRDARAPHGNYPLPYHTFGRTREESAKISTRFESPFTEMGIRSIPGSHRYIMSAVPHHGEAFGSLVLLDLNVEDDGAMSQLKRITPYAKFPEVETPGRRYDVQQYGTPWPLSEDYYLCVYFENMYLLDRFGNQEFIVAPSETPGRQYQFFRAMDPIPLRSRPKPPVIPMQTHQGDDAHPSAPKATVAVINIYEADLPWPQGTRIKWLRVTQNIVKPNHTMDNPRIGYGDENCPRIPLGIVPVEPDGSAYFEAPVEKELIFQALDENFMAIQSMKSVAYVHPGEQLTCVGCHEHKMRTPPAIDHPPMALRREPSRLMAEVEPIEPVNFHRLVKPIFEGKCVQCHRKEKKGPTDMSYKALEPYAFYWAGGFLGHWIDPEHNGSRTIPGRFGARNSRIGKALLDKDHWARITSEEYRRIVLWLDSNSPELGAFHGAEAQRRGELVWPKLDVDPRDPLGVGRASGASAEIERGRLSGR